MKTLGFPTRLALSILSMFLLTMAREAAGDTLVSGTISASTTWTLANSPYVVTADLFVAGTATPVLTIQPGVTVKFNQNVGLYVGYNNPGGLQAVGTSGSPIVFTANTASPVPGYWRWISFYPLTTSTTQISYATVNYGGQSISAAILVSNCSPTISNVTVSNNLGAGIYVGGGSPSISSSTFSSNPVGLNLASGSTPSLSALTIANNTGFAISQDPNVTFTSVSGLSLTGNGTNGIEVRSGGVTTNTTWTSNGWPYIVTGFVAVKGTATPVLTIQPGVTMKFNPNTSLSVGSGSPGGLQAIGTSGSPITFTANTASPVPGYWQGVWLYALTTATTQISYATISYGGTTSFSLSGLYIQGSSPTISNVTVSSNLYAGVYVNGGSPSISSSTISSNPVGIKMAGGATPSLTALTITSNTGFAISQDCSPTIPVMSGLTMTGNGTNGIELRAGTITANTTWKNVGFPYMVTGDVWVEGTATPSLTIEAGVTVKFNQNFALRIGFNYPGDLQAIGTSVSPLTFTANSASPTPGFWRSVAFGPLVAPTAKLVYATVSYGGYSAGEWGGVFIQGGSPLVQNVTLTNNGFAGLGISGGTPTISNVTISSSPSGISTRAPSSPSLQTVTISGSTSYAMSQDCNQSFAAISGLSLTGNSINAVQMRPGTIATNTTWKNSGWPYIVTGDIHVEGSSTPVLTIEAGVTMMFSQNANLFIGQANLGALQANGTSTSPITFTANTATPVAGYWHGIQLYALTASTSQISYATVSYAGSTSLSLGGIYIQGCSPALQSVTISNNAYAGIKVNGGDPSIVSSTFASNPAGVINQIPTQPVNAVLNYWGATTGPSGIGTGTGQSVSSGVAFNPWLTAAPTVPEYFTSGTASSPRFNPSSGTASWSIGASQSGTWTLAISNSAHTVIRTISGTGANFTTTWNGKNDSGVLQPDGTYSYTLQATSSGGTAGPAAGTLLVDSLLSVILTAPTNGQSFSNVYTNGVTDVNVVGSANMTGIVGWQLKSGATSVPRVWSQLGGGTTGVVNSTLGIWSSLAPNQSYTLWLFAWDAAGYYSEAKITVTTANFTVSEGALQLDRSASNTVTYTSIVPFTLTETLLIKNISGTVVRTLVNAVPRVANTYGDVWDGKNDSGTYLPDGAYFYVATVTDGTHNLTWDLTTQYLNDWSSYINSGASGWDPFRNQPMTVGYSFPQAGRVYVVLSPTDFNDSFTCAYPYICLKADAYEEAGPHTVQWAGLDGAGTLRTDLTWMFIFSQHSDLSKNAIVLFGTKASVSNVAVTPWIYGPANGPQTVAFDLATFQSQPATVTVTFLNLASMSVLRTITLTGQTPGHKTPTWDGHGDNGMWVAPGNYAVTVSATDAFGNTVQNQTLTALQY